MDQEKTTIGNITACKFLTTVKFYKTLNAMEPDKNFGLESIRILIMNYFLHWMRRNDFFVVHKT